MAYGWRTVVLTMAPTSRQQAMTSNPNRVSLMVTPITAGLARISSDPGTLGTGVWGVGSIAGIQVFSYRDYGPIIQASVWIENVGAGAFDVSVTELFRTPGC